MAELSGALGGYRGLPPSMLAATRRLEEAKKQLQALEAQLNDGMTSLG